MESPTFQYSPLQDPASDLRLLTIKRRHVDDPIECTIRTVSKEDQPDYRALSYVWGDAVTRPTIVLNGKPFQVTANLESALRHIRSAYFARGTSLLTSVVLWVDAICIDQENLEERNEQVQRMRDIYKSAREVIIWLGKEHEQGDNAHIQPNLWGFDHLVAGGWPTTVKAFTLVKTLERLERLSHTDTEEYATFPEAYKFVISDLESWGYLALLYKRPWFNRLWVIQELAVSGHATVYCGHHTISWTLLEAAANLILNPKPVFGLTQRSFHPFMGAENVYHVSLWDADRQNLLSLLKHTQNSKCTDPRDRLYAVLGIVENAEDVSDVRIDYEKPVEEVYMNWAWKRIQRTRGLDIFSACADSGSRGLPSWVPDLRHPWGNDIPLFSRTHGLPVARNNPKFIAGGLEVVDDVTLWGRKLLVRAIHIGFISALSPVGDVTGRLKDPTMILSGLLDVIQGWESFSTSYFPYRHGDWASGPFVDALLRGYRNWGGREDTPLRCRYRVWRDLAGAGDDMTGNTEAVLNVIHETNRILFKMMHNCQMFITSDGDFGIVAGNCHAEVGDSVYVVRGCATPFIFRVSGLNHRLMGPCYVGRRMHGETIDEFKRGERDESTIYVE